MYNKIIIFILLKQITCNPHLMCWNDFTHEKTEICRPLCTKGSFSLPGMKSCLSWLGCEEIDKNVRIIKEIGHGAVKTIYLAHWHQYNVAVNVPRTNKFIKDFRHGLNILLTLQPHSHVIQLIGHCQDMYLTEYHPLGSSQNFVSFINSDNIKKYLDISRRFKCCMDYVTILTNLHNDHMISDDDSPSIGRKVMCDSNDLNKTLQQYLLKEDLTLILNDVDSVAEIDDSNPLIKCGHRELGGDFVAPEQLWSYEDKEFSDDEMPPYDEKSDIWKIPDLCNYFLGESKDALNLKLHLLSIHTKCKEENPKDRPSASQVLKEYEQINVEMFDLGDTEKIKVHHVEL